MTKDVVEGVERVPLTQNLYAYCVDNAVNAVDPAGDHYLRFNGYYMRLYNNTGIVIRKWRCRSGDPWTFGWSQEKGPLPPGGYTIYPGSVKMNTGWGDWSIWGPGRIRLYWWPSTKMYGRSGFYIHGGDLRHPT